MKRVLQTFIDQLYSAGSESDLTNALTTAVEALDLPRFAYLGISKRAMDNPRVITTYSGAWAYRYFDQAYQNIDPVVVRAFSSHLPFHWGTPDTLNNLSKKTAPVFRRGCGVRYPSGLYGTDL